MRLRTVPRILGTSNKSLDLYSLTATLHGRQPLTANGWNQGLNGEPAQPMGQLAVLRGVYCQCEGANKLPREANLCAPLHIYLLFVQDWSEDGYNEMCEIRGPLIELQPPHDAMLGQILRYPRFRDAQMSCKLGLDGV